MPRRPHVLVMVSDDQGPWALGCAGNRELRTPHLDALAADGIRFAHWFCVSPVCSAARASLLTGQVPSQHGVHDWLRAGNSVREPGPGGELIQYLAGRTTYVDCLAAAGYRCGLSGKWHLGDGHHPQHGFSSWYAHAHGGGPYYGWPRIAGPDQIVEEPGYVTDRITEEALAFLEAGEDDTPWYLSVHYTAPHSPWGREHHPADLWDDYHANCPFESVPREGRHPYLTGLAGFFTNEATRRNWLAGYYAAIEAMDRGIGQILAWLTARGLRQDTLVLFVSDNGMNMGHHGVCGKGNGTYPLNFYEESVTVPAILSRPGHLPAGLLAEGLYAHYDWLPTLLDYLDLPLPGTALPGRSFADLLRGAPERAADPVLIFDEYGHGQMIRSRQHKLVWRHPQGFHEFYDLAADPRELSNRIHDRAHRTTIAALREQLAQFVARYAEPAHDGRRLDVTGLGQLDRCTGPAPFAEGWPRG
ncbi:MAG: sulfatase-like hydrolase/transferase [Fimbriimonadaceae bacterium]|nr:sulfatase-like hydrolase/transferase [Fimbriimonadaceae bacterium]